MSDRAAGARALDEMQAVVDGWIRAHGGYWDEWVNLARLLEEAGELAAAFQRARGWRPRPAEADLAGELGDLLWVLLVIASQQEVDLAAAFEQTLTKVTARDGEAWRAWQPPAA
jgi:NTP pyrophosphatase (non-canonical NTP hydrolase)